MKIEIHAVSVAEMTRDRAVYRKVMKKINFVEKVSLMGTLSSYPGYQRILFRLAKKHGVAIPEIPPQD
jgi:uncharacterized protein YlxP (DUF503 family)